VAEQDGPVSEHVELLGRVAAAMAMEGEGDHGPVARLRHACGALLEIPSADFPDYLHGTWDDIRADLTEYGPEFDAIPQEQADRLMKLIGFVVGTLKRIAGI
jgi:hypothetical protein